MNTHNFTTEEENRALEILESIKTCREAAEILLSKMKTNDVAQFGEVAELLGKLIVTVGAASAPYAKKQPNIILPLTSQSMLESFRVICACWPEKADNSIMKLQFELIPALEEAYMQFYYWAYVDSHPDREQRYYCEEIFELASNPYVNKALETNRYKYDVCFQVLAFNHLDYTKQCVESLLKNIPRGLNYELILWDNGSTDGTVAYFESIHPTKLIESRHNWSIGLAPMRAVESRYYFGISNDVVILPGAIENALACIQSADDIARVVPTTPNVSNLQTIPAHYENWNEMICFAQENNVMDPNRWEQRTRLIDPLSLCDMRLCYSKQGLCSNGYLSSNCNSFPDDRMALLCRRAGYKMYLAKDAYCYHFGSVTLKDEVAQYNEQKFYNEGRQKFLNWFGIDPWGIGFCYDPIFLKRIVGDHTGHVEVLGINCGMGSNSLKIKEQIKEYCRNMDCTLTNITDDPAFFLDLKGVSDAAEQITKIKEFKTLLYQRNFDYIVWETPYLTQYKFSTLLGLCLEHLAEEGVLLLKLTEQTKSFPQDGTLKVQKLGEDWLAVRKEKLS